MNRCYRLVWDRARQLFVVASEISRGRGKAGRTSRTSRLAWLAVLPLSLSPVLGMAAAMSGVIAPAVQTPLSALPIGTTASPSGGHVTAGSGHISQSGLTTTIDQHSQNLSLNWLSFDVGADSTVNFLQPNAQSIAVNRIADPNGSVILGHLNANGQVFLINPNGVLFGKGAQVNVGGLVASTLDVSDSELGRGTLHFGGAGGGSVTNRGTLIAAPGGYVALLGHSVSNQGAIHAPAGSVALAGGSAVTLSFDGNHLLDMQVDASTLNALAENKQLIVADGGQVLMSAGAKDALLASVVNNTGTIQAQTVENRAGKIVLLGGMEAGTTQVAGTLDASAPNGGDGGFIETSAAHVQVADGTKITTMAVAGNSGTWLIDPTDFTIAASGGDMTGTTLSSQLGGGNVTIQSTGGSAGTAGDINVNDTVSWSANTLTLNALNNININAAMNASGTAGLALAYGQAAVAAGNAATYHVNAPVNLASSGSFSTRLGSDGTAINYTIITSLGVAGDTTSTTLQGIGNNLAANYVLGTDIDASTTNSWNAGAGFAPIGNSTTQFIGTFDGLGHTISDLTINRPTQDNVGLFGFVGNGTLRNIGLVGGSVSGADYVGGLVGQVSSGNISNAYATGTVSGNNHIGGLLGYFGGTGSLSQSHATGNVSGAVAGSSYIGGLAGYLDGGVSNLLNVSDVYATGNVSVGVSGSNATGSYIGGLAGFNSANISNAYATGAISTNSYSNSNNSYIGGLVGYNGGATLEYVHATGNINLTTGQYVGGLVGSNENLNGSSLISNAYATGNINLASGQYVGGLVGQNSSFMENSYATGNLVTDPDGSLLYAGGLVGRNGENGKSGFISNVYATGNVDGSVVSMYLGGLVGQNFGFGTSSRITNAYSTGHVSGTLGDRSGGSIGDNSGQLQNVFWNTETAGQGSAGVGTTFGVVGLTSAEMLLASGFAGFSVATTGGTGATWRIYEGHTTPLLSVFLTPYTVNAQPDFDGSGAALTNIASVTVPTDPKILGSVTGGDTLTLAGLAAGGGYTASSNADLSGLYSTQQGYDLIGTATRTISTPGSVAGEVRLDNGASWNSGTLAIATTGNINIAGALNGDALHLNGSGAITDTNALNVSSFVLGGGNWNQIGATLPTFSATDFTLTGGSFVRALGGDGSSATPYQLADVYGLQGVGTLLGNSFTLSNNIDASAATGWNGGAGFAPIGNSTTQFTGIFDGLGHTISGLTINRPTQDNVGLFGFVGNGTLRNIGLVGGSVSGANYVGGLVGQVSSGNISNAYATGTVSGNNYIGGLLGYFGGTGSLSQSYATGNVSGVAAGSSYIGGLAGYLDGGAPPSLLNVSDVYATGNVSVGVSGSTNYIGGLAGYNSANINNAYATGDINITYGNYIGGLVGDNGAGVLEYVHATGNIGISNYGGYVGGLAGSNGDIDGYARIMYAYATGNINADSAQYAGGLVGQNSALIENAYATGNLVADPDGGFMYAGGLVGSNGKGNKPGYIYNVYATGNVEGDVAISMYMGGLVGQNSSFPLNSYISNAYSTGHVSGNLGSSSGGSVGDNGGILENVYWNTETSGQNSAGGASRPGYVPIGLTSAQMLQIGSFGGLNSGPAYHASCVVCGAGISATGGTGATWRIYEGHTTPLLSVFLTPYTLNAQPDFDGSGAALANVASISTTVPTDPKILGSWTQDGTLTLSGLAAGGGYTTTSNAGLSGLYSTQQGYDLIGTISRTISTPGSAAGEVRLDNGASWSNGTLAIATAGNVNIMGALNGDALHLNSGGAITDTAALNVASFVLDGGNWQQLGSLPAFSATDFEIHGGSFVRALGGDGTSGNPWQLTDVYGLQGAGTLLGDSFTLSNDIDASGTTDWNAGAGLAPIGNNATAFTGSFDGLGHTIGNLTINRPGSNYVGLFGYTGGSSVIRNLGVLGGSVSGNGNVGGLAGQNNGTISQAYATGAVNGTSYSTGGLVGFNFDSGTISQSYASGAVTGGSSFTGGLVGANNGAISQAYATGAVSGSSDVGGLAGHNFANGTINQAYATGAVSGSSNVGGLAGFDGGTITNGYWDTETTGQSTSDGGTGLTTAQMMDPASFAAWGTDISAVGGSSAAWRIYAGDTTPLLRTFMTGLAVTAANVGTTYNGTAFTGSSTFIFGALAPSYWLPSTSVDASLILGDANASTSTTAINAGSYMLAGDLYSGQMGYDIDLTAGTLTIGQAALTISSSDVSKTYDGGLGAAGVAVASSGTLFGSDTLSGGNFAFTDKNAGTGKRVTVNGVTVSDGNGGGNYAVTYVDNTSSTINALGITVAAIGTDRDYDGGITDVVTLASAGVLLGDTVNFTGTGAFANKNAGVGKTVSVSGIAASGVDANNYSFNTTANTTATIRQLGITVSATGSNRVYNGTTADTVTLTGTGMLSGDVVSFTGMGNFADKNVGVAKAVGVSGITASGADAGNYSFNTTANTTASISVKPITVDATGVGKVYDGNTSATIAALGSAGLVAGDAVTFNNASAAFADKNAGTGKTVTISGITATGSDTGNYSFSTTASTMADIRQLGITVGATGTNKIYDGSTADAVVLASTGVLSGDTVSFTGTGNFADKNAGVGKTVIVSGISASGANAGNYSFNTSANTTADISQLGIAVNATGVDKVYDGNTADALTLASAGVLSGDTVNFTGTGRFADKNVGSDKTVTVDGIAASGDDAGNYRFNTGAATTASITPATLLYLANPAVFLPGKTPDPLSGTVTGLVGGESLDEVTDGTLAWQTSATTTSPAGTYAIDGSGLSALNYVFAQAPGNATALRVIDARAPFVVANTVAGLQQSGNDTDTAHAPYTPDVHIINGGVRLP